MIIASEVGGVDVPRERRWATFEISYDALAKMLDLPAKCSIVGMRDNLTDNSITIKVIHKDIKETQEGGEFPELLPGQGNWLGIT